MTHPLRAQLAVVPTPYGSVELDMSEPCLFRARAGHVEQRPALAIEGRGYCVDMAFGWHAETDRFGLVAETGPMVWKSGDFESPASDWRTVARAVADAIEAYLATDDKSLSAARAASQRQALGLDRGGMNPALLAMRRSLMGILAA